MPGAVPVAESAQSSYLILGCSLVVAAIGGWIGLWVSGGSANGQTITVTTAMGALLLATIGVRLSRTGGALVDPLTLFCLVVFAYFVIHLFWVINQPEGFGGLQRPYRDALPRSQAWLALGCIALVVGYAIAGASTRRTASRGETAGRVSSTALLVAFAAGMGFQYLAYRAGGTYDARNVLIYNTLGYGAFAAYVVGTLELQDAPKGERRGLRVLVFGVMLPVQSVWALSHGSKTGAVVVLIAYLVVRQVVGRPVRLRWIVIGAAIFLAALTPIVNHARSQRTSAKSLIAAGLVTALVDDVTHPSLPNLKNLEHGFDLVETRTGGSESLAMAVKYTPALRGYQDGRSLAAIPLDLIPHFIWPGKPYYSVGRTFSLVYGGEDPNAGAGLTLAPTVPGDLYMNFGAAGIVGGFFVIGFLLRCLSRITAGGLTELRVTLYVTLVVQSLFLDQDIAVVTSDAFTRVAAAVLFIWLMRLASSRRASAA